MDWVHIRTEDRYRTNIYNNIKTEDRYRTNIYNNSTTQKFVFVCNIVGSFYVYISEEGTFLLKIHENND